MENLTLKQASNYELTPEGTVINKKTGKLMTETNGTVTLSVGGKRKRFKVAELIDTNQPKKKAKKTTHKSKYKGFKIENTGNSDGYVVTTEDEKFFETKVEKTVGYRHCGNFTKLSSAKKKIDELVEQAEKPTKVNGKIVRKVGDERTRKDGRVMVWSKTPTGFDWRRKVDHRRKENK